MDDTDNVKDLASTLGEAVHTALIKFAGLARTVQFANDKLDSCVVKCIECLALLRLTDYERHSAWHNANRPSRSQEGSHSLGAGALAERLTERGVVCVDDPEVIDRVAAELGRHNYWDYGCDCSPDRRMTTDEHVHAVAAAVVAVLQEGRAGDAVSAQTAKPHPITAR